MRLAKSILLSTTLLSVSAFSAQADVNVVASIKPVHSLVAAVMKGVGEPDLIVEGAGSPHNYALKPSQARELENADVVFWVGHNLEAFLEKPLEAIATKAKVVELIDAHGLNKLSFREGGAFDAHDHDHEEHGHDEHAHADEKHDDHAHDEHKHDEHAHADEKHDDHAHDEHKHDEHAHDEHKHDAHGHEDHAHKDEKHDDHAHDEHAHDEHKHDDHGHEEHAHGEGEFDPHVWLDPVNAKALVHEIEEALVAADPEHAATYEANAAAISKQLDALLSELSADLASVQGKPFVVFHDAYQNFENRFGLTAVGSITVSPEVMPGAERISELREKVQGLSATCVFSEPQFEPKLVGTVTEGTDAKTGVLDPLGASIADGPDLYFTLIRNMAESFKTCLSETS